MQTIELLISDESKDGVFAISLVENPAIQEDFVYLSSHEIELKVVDEEQRIVVGYALIPDKEIYRKVNGKEFNIFFSKDTVKKTSELYMKQLNLNNVTVEHNKKIEGATVIESWITEDEKYDKVNMYNLKPIIGGWAVMMKIYNDNEWEAVKRGEYKGFSIEGKFDGFDKLEQSKIDKMDLKEELKKIIKNGLELESQMVELSLAEDVERESKTMTNYFSQLTKMIDDFNAKGKQMKAFADKISKESDSSILVMQKYEKAAKDLGVVVPSSFAVKKKAVENLQKMTDKLRLKPLEISTNPGAY
jgi:hypothetical protein